jgi:exopolysaccharide biosynthesis WecB/TagA/CpsF family protein
MMSLEHAEHPCTGEAKAMGDQTINPGIAGWATTRLGGLPIVRAGLEDSAQRFIDHALSVRGTGARPLFSTSANGQVIAMCAKDAAQLQLLLSADQIHADGMPMVMYSRLFSKEPVRERVATTDLVQAVASKAEDAGVSFYFLGGTEEVNARAVEAMRKAYPRLVFAGRRNGYFRPDEEPGIVADIAKARPDILWVGLGVPLEQKFVLRNLERLRGVGIVKTSGGLFDFVSGKNRRAPQWMQRAGLEWAFRLLLEPRRLAVRYLLTNPVALYTLIRDSR